MNTEYKDSEIGLIPKDWNIDELQENLIIKGRIGWKGLKKSEYLEEGYAIINGQQILDGAVDWKNVGRISEDRYLESPEIMLQQDDILMTKDGTIGKTAYVRELKEPATVASGVFVIRNNSDKITQKFLYQYFSSHYFKHLVQSRIEGSVIPHIYQKDIQKLAVPLPPVSEQEQIAKILFDIDDKIDVNKKINENLEELGKTLFKRWFIDFEFPNEEGEPYKSSGGEMIESELGMIPKGWEIKKMIELVSMLKPGTNYQPKRIDEGVPFLNGRNIIDGVINTKDISYISKEDYEFIHKKWIPEENDLLITRIGTLGNVGIVRKKDLPIGIHYNMIVIKENDKYIKYPGLYFMIKSEYFLKEYHLRKKQTVQEYITIDEVENIPIFYDSDIIKKFENSFDKLLKLILQNKQNIENLEELKQSLLPKLMSGQIRVK